MSQATALRVVDQADTVTAPAEQSDEFILGRVEEFAAGLPEKFLHCREMGHNWRPWTAGRYKDGGYQRILRCVRCHTKKRQNLSPRGMILTTNYEHPDGYLTKGIGQIAGEGRGLLRLESIARIGVDLIEED